MSRQVGAETAAPDRLCIDVFTPDQAATSRLLSDPASRLASRGVTSTIFASRGLHGDGDPAAEAALI